MIPGSGRSPGEGHGNPPRVLAWKVPWTEKSSGLRFTGSQSQTEISAEAISGRGRWGRGGGWGFVTPVLERRRWILETSKPGLAEVR